MMELDYAMNKSKKHDSLVTEEKLREIQQKFGLEAVVLVDEWQMPKIQVGDEQVVRAMLQSNAIQSLHSQVPVSLTLGQEDFDVLMLTKDGIIAQGRQSSRILIGLVSKEEYLLLLSPPTDPGFLQYELRQLLRK